MFSIWSVRFQDSKSGEGSHIFAMYHPSTEGGGGVGTLGVWFRGFSWEVCGGASELKDLCSASFGWRV